MRQGASAGRLLARIEPLEPRRLLSAPPSQTWDIVATPGDDTLLLRIDPAHPSWIEASLNGTPVAARRWASLDGIMIKAGRGDDRVILQLGSHHHIPATLFGGAGNDRLIGSAENDVLRGGDGNDTLDGDGGRDTLRGDAGADRLNGGFDPVPDLIYRDASDTFLHARRDRSRHEPRPSAHSSPRQSHQDPGAGWPSPPAAWVNQFAFRLFDQLASQSPGQNLFISPYSIATAAGMFGAYDDGGAQSVARMFGQSGSASDLQAAFAHLLEPYQPAIDGSPEPHDLTMANAAWFQQGTEAQFDDYRASLASAFGAAAQSVNFAHDPASATRSINQWVSDQTHGMIPHLFAPGVLNQDTRFALTNAVYFKGQWARPFNPHDTSIEPFHTGRVSLEQVSMMHQYNELSLSSQGYFRLIELPYLGDDLSMVVLLPRAVDGLRGLEDSLTLADFTAALAEAHPTNLEVSIPRFKLGSSLNLADTQLAMGMPAQLGDLSVTSVVHQANIDVNEQGTQAAAATGVGGGIMGGPAPFRADHPFEFIIRNVHTGGILFMGQVVNPSSTG